MDSLTIRKAYEVKINGLDQSCDWELSCIYIITQKYILGKLAQSIDTPQARYIVILKLQETMIDFENKCLVVCLTRRQVGHVRLGGRFCIHINNIIFQLLIINISHAIKLTFNQH